LLRLLPCDFFKLLQVLDSLQQLKETTSREDEQALVEVQGCVRVNESTRVLFVFISVIS
jgi:hypothetical protein